MHAFSDMKLGQRFDSIRGAFAALGLNAIYFSALLVLAAWGFVHYLRERPVSVQVLQSITDPCVKRLTEEDLRDGKIVTYVDLSISEDVCAKLRTHSEILER